MAHKKAGGSPVRSRLGVEKARRQEVWRSASGRWEHPVRQRGTNFIPEKMWVAVATTRCLPRQMDMLSSLLRGVCSAKPSTWCRWAKVLSRRWDLSRGSAPMIGRSRQYKPRRRGVFCRRQGKRRIILWEVRQWMGLSSKVCVTGYDCD